MLDKHKPPEVWEYPSLGIELIILDDLGEQQLVLCTASSWPDFWRVDELRLTILHINSTIVRVQ